MTSTNESADAGQSDRGSRTPKRRRWRHAQLAARSWATRPMARRSAWVVVDQGVSSITNVLASVLVARSVSPQDFGAFSTAMLVYLVVVNVCRALVSQPLAIRVSARTEQRDEVAAAAGATLVCGVTFGLVIASAGLLVGGTVGAVLMVTGALMPVLALQDGWRLALFTMGEPRRAVANDLAWAVIQIVLLAVVLRAEPGSTVLITAAWGGGAGVAALLGIHQTGVLPRVSQAVAYLRRHLAIGWRFALEVTVKNASTQFTMLAVGIVAGAAGVGAIRGASTLFGPFTVAMLGLTFGGLAEVSRLLARSPHRVFPVLATMSGGLLMLSLSWGAVLLVIPSSWGHGLLGETWPAARELVVPLMLFTGGAGVASGALLGLRVVEAASDTLRLRMVVSTITISGGLTAATRWGASGGAWALAGGAWIGAIGAWWLLGRFRTVHPTIFTGVGDGSGGRFTGSSDLAGESG